MRSCTASAAFAFALALGACSRNPPAPDAARRPASLPPPALRLAAAIEAPADAGIIEAPPLPTLPALSGKTVLHVGDSMVGGQWGLTRALEAKFEKEGAKFVHESKVSESIPSFDKSPRLKELIERYEPDIVILTLGTNDALVPYPQVLGPHVQNIAKRIGGRECYWMGPPLWKPDTGILAVIRDNAAPCKFYDSSRLKLQRSSDGIHPTDRGASEWAEHFWRFFRVPVLLRDAGAP